MAPPLVKSVESDTEDESPAIVSKKTICSICVQKEARYTCPRCNIPYCSLDCYRHKKHEGCSEYFYRDWVMDEMKQTVVKPEDQQKVLEMLSREHEQQATDSDDDDDVPDLHERLAGLDLDCDAAEVWQRLTAKEREDFYHMLKDGRLSRLVPIWTPWWMAKTRSLVQEARGDYQLPKVFPPHLSDIPDIHHLLKGKPSADVKHNVVNVLSAYAFVTRLYNGDHHDFPLQCSQELWKVCEVLKDNMSCPGPKEAVHTVIQEVQKPGSGFVVPRSFPVVLLGDVVRILHGPRLSPVSAVLSALSDLSALLKAAKRELKKASGNTPKRRRQPKPAREGTETKKPGTEAKKPGAEAKKPGAEAKKPGAEAKKPGTEAKKPGAEAKKPGTEADKPGAEGDPEDRALKRRLFLGKKRVTFLLSWAQRFGMCLAPLCQELSLELEVLRCEAADSQSLQKAVEEGLRSGALQPPPTPCAPHTKIQELS